jgi:hypothetical protein
MLQRMGEVCDAVWVGDVSTGVAHLGGRSDPTWNSLPLPAGVRAARAPFPAYDAALASRATLHPAARLLHAFVQVVDDLDPAVRKRRRCDRGERQPCEQIAHADSPLW